MFQVLAQTLGTRICHLTELLATRHEQRKLAEYEGMPDADERQLTGLRAAALNLRNFNENP